MLNERGQIAGSHTGEQVRYDPYSSAKMVTAFPLNTSKDKHWCKRCCSLRSWVMSTSFFVRLFKKDSGLSINNGGLNHNRFKYIGV